MAVDTVTGEYTDLDQEPQEPTQAITVRTVDIMPMASMGQMRQMFAEFKEFIKTEMVDGEDYGLIPGTPKPSLWKPGAEKLCFWFGLGIEFEHVAGEVSATYVAHTYRCKLIMLRSGLVKATCEGSCSSSEANQVKAMRAMQIKARSKNPPEPEPTDLRILDNTIKKLAQKRALVGATLFATAGSSFFSTHVQGGEEGEMETGNGHTPAQAATKLCTIHNVQMRLNTNDKGSWYSHKTPDGKWCNGPKDDAPPPAPSVKRSAPAETPAPAESTAIPADRSGRLNYVLDQAKKQGKGVADVNAMVKERFMHGAIGGCTDIELEALCQEFAGVAPATDSEEA